MRTSRQRLETEGEMGTSPPFCLPAPLGGWLFPEIVYCCLYYVPALYLSLSLNLEVLCGLG